MSEELDIKKLVYGGRFNFDPKKDTEIDDMFKNMSEMDLKPLSMRVRGWIALLYPKHSAIVELLNEEERKERRNNESE